MLPRWHILYGVLFTLLLWIVAPETSWIYLILILFAAIMIDFDHYICGVLNTRRLHLRHIFSYHTKQDKTLKALEQKGYKPKSDFHLFHTVEFHVLIGFAGIFIAPLFYLFIGMIFHSLLDVFSLLHKGVIHRREYFLLRWLQCRV